MVQTNDMLKQVENSAQGSLENLTEEQLSNLKEIEEKILSGKIWNLKKESKLSESKNTELKSLEEKAIGFKETLTKLNSDKEQAQTMNQELMEELVRMSTKD